MSTASVQAELGYFSKVKSLIFYRIIKIELASRTIENITSVERPDPKGLPTLSQCTKFYPPGILTHILLARIWIGVHMDLV
jgi:hypothetical protein